MDERRGGGDAAWPEGWSRPRWGGWALTVVFGVVAVVPVLVGLLVLARKGVGSALEGAPFCVALAAAFGGTAFGFRPAGRGAPRSIRLRPDHDAHERGLAFDYSRSRQLGMVVGLLAFLVLGVLIAVTSDKTSTVVVGWVMVALLGSGLALAAAGGLHRSVVLTVERLVVVRGRHRIAVDWADVVDVLAVEQRANNVRTRYVGVLLSSGAAVSGEGAVMRWMSRSDRRLSGVDLTIPTACLAVAPALLVLTAQRLARDPAAREAVLDGP